MTYKIVLQTPVGRDDPGIAGARRIPMPEVTHRRPVIVSYTGTDGRTSYFVTIPIRPESASRSGADAFWPMFELDSGNLETTKNMNPTYETASAVVTMYQFVRYLGHDEFCGFSGN